MKAETAVPLKTVDDVSNAYEWLFNQQKTGTMDAKTADALNTTLKGATYLRAKLRLDAAKLVLQARIKKIEIPPALLPSLE